MTGAAVRSFGGLKVLVLEDEALVSMLIEDMLIAMGCEVIGPFLRIDRVREFLQRGGAGVDFALIDVNVGGVRSFNVAAELVQAGIPFIFVTGYDEPGIDERWRSWPRLRKPVMPEDLLAALDGHFSAVRAQDRQQDRQAAG
ncbi:MAG TPA: response regulator [Xanthobacteraceae bacterium]|nr:response regulator [Xanthobacteraceae bacterium]